MSLRASDILALSKAGYTSQQIALISAAADREAQEQPKPDPQPAPKSVEPPKPDPQPVEQPKPEQPAPKPEPEQDPQPAQQTVKPDAFDGIMAELQKLNQNIYQSNIRNSNLPDQQSAEDIIAEIIRPTKTNQGG